MAMVQDCREGAKDGAMVAVKVGDFVGFKSDYEQYGVITKIVGNDLHLHSDNGFGGDYLRYTNDTVERASDCWLDR